MSDPAKTIDQNILPVQALFNLDNSFNTFIGQGQPFYATVNPIQSGLTITNSTIDSSIIGGNSPSLAYFTTAQSSNAPVSPFDLTNKQYVDYLAAGLSWKEPATVATLTNITLSGLQTIDGVSLVAGNVVLVKNQTNAAQNGIYTVSSGAWTYTPGSDTWNEYVGAIIFIVSGTQAGSAWYSLAQPGGTLGTTPITWSNFSVSSVYTAGTGLTLTGTQFSITNTAVTAGSYGSASSVPTYTVNAQGQLTAASNTTIAISNSQVSGLGTLSTQNASNVSITGGSINGTTIGASSPSTGAFTTLGGTTISASTQFTGPGTGLTGTATSLNIGGNAATATTAGSATTATTATNLAGGASNYLPYQSASNTTSFLTPSAGVLQYSSGLSWTTTPTLTGTNFSGIPNGALNNSSITIGSTSISLGSTASTLTSVTMATPTISSYETYTATSAPSYNAGRLWYDSTQNALAYYNDVTNNTLHIGEEIQLKVYNNTGSTINVGQPVYVTSTSSGFTYPNVALAIANTLTTGNVIGLANQAIPTGTAGYVTTIGLVQGVNTGSYTVGDTLYLSPYSAGYYQNTIPPTGYAIKLGTVAYVNSSNGAIYVNKSILTVQAGNIVGQVALTNGGTGANLTAVAGGAVYSSGSALGITAAGLSGQVLTSNGSSAPTWQANAALVTITDNTSSSSTYYPLLANATSGTVNSVNTSSTKLQFVPQTGLLTTTALSAGSLTLTTTPLAVGSGGTGLSSLTAGYVPYGNGTSAFGNSANLQFTGSNLLIGQTYDQGTGSLQNTGNATVNGNLVDKQLYLQGGNNLILQSQTFTTSPWTTSNSSVTLNTTTAPNSTATGSKIVESATTSSHYIQQIITVSALSATYSVYAKAAERSFIILEFGSNAGGYAWFNLSTGAVGTAAGGLSASNCSITSVGNGWYKCSINQTLTAGSLYANIYCASTNGASSYAGDGTSGVYVWGAQLEYGSQASSYTPTTTTAVTTTNNISVPSGSVAIGGTTNSTSNTTGALTIVGGIGSSSNIYASGGATSSTSPTTGGIWAYQPYPAFAGGFLNSPVIGFTASAWNSSSGSVASQAYMQLNALTFNVNPPTSKLSFYISANGASPTEKMYLSSAGALTTTADSTFNTVTVGLGGGSVSTNTAVGYQSLNATTTGGANTALGYQSLRTNTTSTNNVAIGYQSLFNNSTSSNLTAVGTFALLNNTTNVATLGTITGGSAYTNGTYTGVVMTLSSGSTATTYPTATIVVSGGAVTSVTLTSNGVGFKDTTTVLTAPAASIGGTGSGFSVPVASLASGSTNTAVGYQALTANTVATGNTATGSQCLVNTTSGRFNVGYGAAAGYANTTGAYNVFVGGQNAGGIANGNANTSGNYLTAVGAGALASNSTSNALTGIGYMALYSATGANNIALGYQAGYAGTALTTGTNNIFIGYQAQASTASDTNEIVIGYNQVGLGSNTTVIGNSSTTLTKAFGVITSTVYTVATLPSASTSGAGARAFVTDALAPTFGATVTGGGAVNVPVYSDGTNWKVG